MGIYRRCNQCCELICGQRGCMSNRKSTIAIMFIIIIVRIIIIITVCTTRRSHFVVLCFRGCARIADSHIEAEASPCPVCSWLLSSSHFLAARRVLQLGVRVSGYSLGSRPNSAFREFILSGVRCIGGIWFGCDSDSTMSTICDFGRHSNRQSQSKR